MRKFIFNFSLLMVFATTAWTQEAGHGIAAALINVVENDSENTTNSVSVTTTISINEFKIRAGSNRGDYNVQIGAGFSDDVDSGVLMTCAAENGRNGTFCTTAIDYSRSAGLNGALYIPVFSAPAGAEYNMNVAAAHFPYTKWIGGYARNSEGTNGGPNNLFTGSPGLTLGTHFIDLGGGVSTVDLRSLGINANTDGTLLVTHGRNEDNFALSRVNADGTWTVYVKDNGADAAAYEQDPVAFVYIPRTNTTVVSGRFRGDGVAIMFNGPVRSFNVTNISTGTWRLTINGHSPATGVLIVSAEGGFSQNQDNIVSYQPDGDGWILQSRDVPGNGLQTPTTSNQPAMAFVFIPSAVGVNLVSPPDNAENRSSSPKLEVSVTNTTSGDLTVKFFGRQATTSSEEDFMIVALPDTQYYTAERNGGKKEMFIAQTEWIITNRVSRNIAYVTQLGDISDQGDIKSGAANTTEWRNATNAMYRLENPTRTLLTHGIPYGVAVGNHDSEPNGDPNGTTTFYNQYFGIAHFSGKSYYGGHYGTNNDNHYDLFSAGGMNFIVIYFEYDTSANPAVLAWANQILQSNKNRRAILVTHYFGSPATPVSFSAQGSAIYNALKHNTNIFMMLSGHVTGAGQRADTFNGNTIRTFVSDYQGWTNGGNGFMRLMTFSPKNNQVIVQTFSPYTGEYRTESNHEFFFNYNMAPEPPEPFVLVGTVSNVPPGGTANMLWPNRQIGATYEWKVVLTDTVGNTTTGPLWKFSTGPNAAPVVTNRLVTLVGNAPTNVTLSAVDINGDDVVFITNTTPAHGLILNFDPAAGTFTYLPTHGYYGFNHFVYSATDGFSTSTLATLNFNVLRPSDTNANSLPDDWEARYGISDPDADDDGDGHTNLQEYLANTNPTNAASVLRITDAVRDENGHVTLSWPSVGGTRYRIQYSNGGENGSLDGEFIDVVRPIGLELDPGLNDEESTQVFVDDFTLTGNPSTNKARYYRVKSVQ